MEESFELPIQYRNREIVCTCKLVTTGYSYRIYLQAEDQEIIFEPDEERNLRALYENQQSGKSLPADLIRIIGEALEKNLLP